MNFCVKCGRDCEESLNGLCIDCWLRSRRLAALPHHVNLKVCTNCGEYEFKNRWLKKDRLVAVQDAATNALLIIYNAVPISVTIVTDEQDPHVYAVTIRTICDVMGYQVEDETSTTVRIKNTVCRRCSRQLGSYYEAILQIRTKSGRLSREDKEDTITLVENSVARQATVNRSLFITKIELVTGGVDVYLSSMSLGKSLARELADHYCAETKESPKLVSQTTDGRNVYRITYLVRLPEYHVGDVVVFQGRHYKLTRINGNGGKVVDLMDFRERVVHRADMVDIKLYARSADLKEATVVNKSGSEIQVLDPDNYSTMDLRIPQGADIGETVRVVAVDDALYYVP